MHVRDWFGTTLGRFRLVALAEGLSTLALFGVAMPLKYLADMPMAVRIVGTLHGVLFVSYVVVWIAAWIVQRWSAPKALLGLGLSVVPFGAFVFDHSLRDEQPAEAQVHLLS